MKMFNETNLFKEPLEIKRVLSKEESEMSFVQQAMLCGLIKEYRPEKIVEVGVSAGGTTAVILNCISMLSLDTEVYSVDALEYYYRDSSKKSGYLAEECKLFLGREVCHVMYRGGVLPQFLEDIGGNIDFLVLDTVHMMPGEMLDFLAVLPWLKDGAVVVLHDIFLNHYAPEEINSYATRVLLSSVTGEKIIGRGNDGFGDYIGLGVFRITSDTRKYIEDLFCAMMLTWQYMPDLEQIEVYRGWFSRIYANDLLEEFNTAIEINKNTLSGKESYYNKCKAHGVSAMIDLAKKLENKENVYIYGCGIYGKALRGLMEGIGVEVKGYVVSDNQDKPKADKNIKYISDIDVDNSTIILAMSDKNQEEVYKGARTDNWICIDERMRTFLRI